MKKNKLAKAIAPLLLSVSISASSADIQNQSGATGNSNFIPLGGGSVLWDQTANASGNGAPDQDFEAAFDVYDSWGADDFVVNSFGWSISRVNTVGTQSLGGSAVSVDVEFLSDAGGSPGAVMCSYAVVVPTSQVDGSFQRDLPGSCELTPGTYWLAIQTNQDFGGGNGQHFWSNATVQTGNPGHWVNPGDGFGSGCTTWTPQTTCGVGGGVNPDFLFQIEGSILPPPVVPSLNWLGLALMFFTLGFVGHKFIRKQDA